MIVFHRVNSFSKIVAVVDDNGWMDSLFHWPNVSFRTDDVFKSIFCIAHKDCDDIENFSSLEQYVLYPWLQSRRQNVCIRKTPIFFLINLPEAPTSRAMC